MTTKLTKMAVPKVGAKPEGNPDVMEHLAGRCRTLAGDLLEGCSAATSAVDPGSMHFNGRKAAWIRGSVGRNSSHAQRTAHRMQSFAKNLETGAMELRTQIKAYNDSVKAAADAVAHNKAVDAQKAAETNPLGIAAIPGLGG